MLRVYEVAFSHCEEQERCACMCVYGRSDMERGEGRKEGRVGGKERASVWRGYVEAEMQNVREETTQC